MGQNIVALVGQNENEVLKVVAGQIMDLMKPYGIQGHVIDLYDQQWSKKFEALAADGILFAWASAGIGAKLTVNGRSLWDIIRVPFISALADHPAQMPPNHRTQAKFVVNGYLYKEHLAVQQQIVRSPQMSVLIPHGIAPNPYSNRTPWNKRSRKIVFLKSGGDPAARSASWQVWPNQLRSILEESSAQALQLPTGDITPIVLACLNAYGIDLSERHDILLALLNEVDWYVRLVRLTMMAKALCRVPADIIGARWEHIDQTGSRAKFHAAINAAQMPELFADTKFVINVTPNFSSGTHERIPNGFSAKACVLSDDNSYTKAKYSNLPNYFGFSWDDPDWEEKVVANLEDPKIYDDDQLQPACDLANEDYNGRKLMMTMLNIAEIVKFGEQLGHFTYEPKS